MSDYARWLKSETTFGKRNVLNRIENIEQLLHDLRNRIENDAYLNTIGELQSEGPMLDAAIAAYAAQRRALKNYQDMEEG